MNIPQFLVLCGDGINCENETARAFHQIGLGAQIIHINDLLHSPGKLLSFDGLALPGGFSFGDELGSGQILALKLRHKMGDLIEQFYQQKRPIIGICNGMQVLVKLGLIPYGQLTHGKVSMAPNKQGHFQNRWVEVQINKHSNSPWIRFIKDKSLAMPIRHGEGQVYFADEKEGQKIWDQQQAALVYSEDCNGSSRSIAGLTDPSGMCLGLMPHPEASMDQELAPLNFAHSPLGREIFLSIKKYFQQ